MSDEERNGGFVPAPRRGEEDYRMIPQRRAEPGSETLTFTAGAMAVARQHAGLMHKTVGEVVSNALALQQAVLEARSSGARVLVEKQGRVQELQVELSTATPR
jgi:hypothetical protein